MPKRGYRCRDTQSQAAFHWLISEEMRQNIIIQHAGRGDEVRISGIPVDGYYVAPDNTKHVYQVFFFAVCYMCVH